MLNVFWCKKTVYTEWLRYVYICLVDKNVCFEGMTVQDTYFYLHHVNEKGKSLR